jgi:hypothetical protein
MTDRCLKVRARVIVKTVILPVVAAAFETYPELDTDEVLALCAPALTDRLFFELKQDQRDKT